jgi:hypothetical protein
MNALSKFLPSAKHLSIGAALAFFMLLTRGSHVLTTVSLPDASLAVFLLGGLFLKRSGWFALFFILGTIIDFGAAALDPAQGFCLTNGYWGLIPAYGTMWLGGLWLSTRQDAFALLAFGTTSIVTAFAAFVISTQTYYLFSGRFPNNGVLDTLQYGWNYLPGWMGFAAMYFAIIWIAARILRKTNFVRSVEA